MNTPKKSPNKKEDEERVVALSEHKKDRITIDPKMNMAELIEKYPELIEPLTYDYGLHCVNCMISEFDTLEQGALIHGIDDKDLEEMVKDLENIVNNKTADSDLS